MIWWTKIMVFLSLEVSSLCISGINYSKRKLSFCLMSLLVKMLWYLYFHRKKRENLFWGSFISSSRTVCGLVEFLEMGLGHHLMDLLKLTIHVVNWSEPFVYRINKFQGSSVSFITCVAAVISNLFLQLYWL